MACTLGDVETEWSAEEELAGSVDIHSSLFLPQTHTRTHKHTLEMSHSGLIPLMWSGGLQERELWWTDRAE